MPTYDYACRACGHAFEHFQSMTDKVLRTCPECRKRSLERLIGAGSGIVFKGSGFYETDYKRAGSKPPADGPPAKAGGDGAQPTPDSGGAAKGGGKGARTPEKGGQGDKTPGGGGGAG